MLLEGRDFLRSAKEHLYASEKPEKRSKFDSGKLIGQQINLKRKNYGRNINQAKSN
jgi:hypothetical protein